MKGAAVSSSFSSAAVRKESKGIGKKRRREGSDQRDAVKHQSKKQSDFDKLLKEVQDKMAAQRKGQGGSREEQGGRSEGSNWGGGGQHGGGYGYYNDKAGSSSSQPGGMLPQGHRGGGRFGGAMQGGRGGGRGRGYSRRTPSREALVSRAVSYSAAEHYVL